MFNDFAGVYNLVYSPLNFLAIGLETEKVCFRNTPDFLFYFFLYIFFFRVAELQNMERHSQRTPQRIILSLQAVYTLDC